MPERDIWETFEELWEFVVGQGPRILVSRVYKPPMNMYETEEYFVVQLDLSGTSKDEINVIFKDGYLLVTGKRNDKSPKEMRQYHTLEIYFGPFERRIYIGSGVDTEGIKTSYRNGLLEVRIPKDREKEISINIEEE